MKAITLEESVSALEASNKSSVQISNKEAGNKARLVQRNYVMNDIGALKKKLAHEKRKHDFNFAKEAKDAARVP